MSIGFLEVTNRQSVVTIGYEMSEFDRRSLESEARSINDDNSILGILLVYALSCDILSSNKRVWAVLDLYLALEVCTYRYRFIAAMDILRLPAISLYLD